MSKLGSIFEGWNGYQTSILHAIEPLTTEQLLWRPAPGVRSLGEIIRHLSLGRITWLSRMSAAGIEDVCHQVPRWYTDSDGARHVVEDSVGSDESEALSHWLALSWEPIHRVLEEWTVEDLFRTYRHKFRGTQYIVSNQWTLWRIMSHDLHHGGQIAMMLACQEIPAVELRALGGHVIAPPVAPSQE
ncbi:MAG TPA: DinB family protein [Terracidiphilus sp.]|jgi:uncharacterized damage-inducible protein DinB